jgi:hypothetical protein
MSVAPSPTLSVAQARKEKQHEEQHQPKDTNAGIPALHWPIKNSAKELAPAHRYFSFVAGNGAPGSGR